MRAFRRRHPRTFIVYIVQNATYCRVLDANPDLDLVLYSEHLWVHGVSAITPDWLQSLPLALDAPAPLHHFDMHALCARPGSFREHIALGFSRLLGIPIDSTRPVVHVTPEERRIAAGMAPRPYAVFSMHSNANPAHADGTGAKDWGRANWHRLAGILRRQWSLDVIAVGAECDERPAAGQMQSLYGLPIKIVAALLEGAACVVTLENGIAHLAAGVDARLVELYAPIVPPEWAAPAAGRRVRVIYRDPRQISAEDVASAIQVVIAGAPAGTARQRHPEGDVAGRPHTARIRALHQGR